MLQNKVHTEMTVFAGRLEEPFLSNIKDFYRIDGLKNWP